MTTCSNCNRALNDNDANADGKCVFCDDSVKPADTSNSSAVNDVEKSLQIPGVQVQPIEEVK